MKDFIWVAYLDWDDKIVVEQIEVKSRSEKQIVVVDGGKATGFRTRLRPDFGFATKRDALESFLKKQIEAKHEADRSSLMHAERIGEIVLMIDEMSKCPT